MTSGQHTEECILKTDSHEVDESQKGSHAPSPEMLFLVHFATQKCTSFASFSARSGITMDEAYFNYNENLKIVNEARTAFSGNCCKNTAFTPVWHNIISLPLSDNCRMQQTE